MHTFRLAAAACPPMHAVRRPAAHADLYQALQGGVVSQQALPWLALDADLSLCDTEGQQAPQGGGRPGKVVHTQSGAMRPAIRRSVVDLPEPEPPMMPTASPRLTVMLEPRSTRFLPNDLCTLRSSISTWPAPARHVSVLSAVQDRAAATQTAHLPSRLPRWRGQADRSGALCRRRLLSRAGQHCLSLPERRLRRGPRQCLMESGAPLQAWKGQIFGCAGAASAFWGALTLAAGSAEPGTPRVCAAGFGSLRSLATGCGGLAAPCIEVSTKLCQSLPAQGVWHDCLRTGAPSASACTRAGQRVLALLRVAVPTRPAPVATELRGQRSARI